jgi:hypothetical protein
MSLPTHWYNPRNKANFATFMGKIILNKKNLYVFATDIALFQEKCGYIKE